MITPRKTESREVLAQSEIRESPAQRSSAVPDPLENPNSNPAIQSMRLEKEVRRLRRENARFLQEIRKLNDLIEQMKNIDDDELLMIEKIQTKEIYGKAQKVKVSELQKETEKIRIEIDRLKVVNNNKDRLLRQKDTELVEIRERLERVNRQRGEDQVKVRTEYRDRPETTRRMRDLEDQLRRARSTSQIKTVTN